MIIVFSLTLQSQSFLSVEDRVKINVSDPDCVVIVYNYDNIEIETSLNSYLMKVGYDVGLYAQVLKDGKSARQLLENEEIVVISNADMVIEAPNGKETDVPMHDDGLFSDRVRGDHIYSASVPTHAPGTYRLSAVLKGYISESNGNKRPFLKTAEHFFYVSPFSVEIEESAWLTKIDNERANINIAVSPDKTVGDVRGLDSFRAYTEVYGVGEDGKLKPACWLGGLVNIQRDSSSSFPYFSLQLNLKWLANANVKGPLTLKKHLSC